MIIREVTITIRPELEEEFLAFWQNDYRARMAAHKGYAGAILLKEQKVENTYQMLLKFESEETSADWRASSDHAELSPLLKKYADVTGLRVFDIAIA